MSQGWDLGHQAAYWDPCLPALHYGVMPTRTITVILYHLCIMGDVYQQLPVQVQISIFTVMREVCDKISHFSDRHQ